MMRVSSKNNNRDTYLFEGFVVYKAGSILGDLELPLLYLLAELPIVSYSLSAQRYQIKMKDEGFHLMLVK